MSLVDYEVLVDGATATLVCIDGERRHELVRATVTVDPTPEALERIRKRMDELGAKLKAEGYRPSVFLPGKVD